MVTFTDKSIIVEIPTTSPFQDYLSLIGSLFEISSQVIKSAEDFGNVNSFYPIEHFVYHFTQTGKQGFDFDRFIEKTYPTTPTQQK